MIPDSRTVKVLGREAGFDLVRIGPASDLHVERLRYLEWLAHGRQGDMRWIDKGHVERSTSPASLLPGARSVISVALAYRKGNRTIQNGAGARGAIARYAWGRDYHAALGEMLAEFVQSLSREFGGDHRWYVDTGPVMDKAHAARSGLGWYGKNTNILTSQFGSFVLLGEIMTTTELEPDRQLAGGCGTCRLCLVACPTGALGPEYTIDSRRCISYLTIEHRGSIPIELRPLMGSWVFGCDICQDVCPPSVEPHLGSEEERKAWLRGIRAYLRGGENGSRQAVPTPSEAHQLPADHPLFSPTPHSDVDLLWLLRLSHAEYVEVFRGTAIKRAKVWMLRRNAAVALGNVGGVEAIEPLLRALANDDHALVRGHAAWALGAISRRLAAPDVRSLLLARLTEEDSAVVRGEIAAALHRE